jgi:RHS repeat-associated protein
MEQHRVRCQEVCIGNHRPLDEVSQYICKKQDATPILRSISRTDALGQTSTTVYTAANQASRTADALGRTTTYEYDAAGNVKKIIDPNNQPTQFEYHPIWNKVTKITDALTQITEFTYDNTNGNLLTVKDPLTHVTTIAYNSFGQPTSVQGPIATEPPTMFAYDTNGNVITTTDPLGNATQRSYDAVSRLTSLTDPRGLQTQFRYDGLNRVTEIADARQGLTRFGYDQNGNLLTVTDAKNQTTTYTYDNMDRLKTRKDALNRAETYNYDLGGNLSQFTDRKNQPTTFEYDALDRQKLTSYADGSTVAVAYDAVGNVTKLTDSTSGSIDWTYDILDRLTQEVTSQGVVRYTYDANSQLAQVAQGPLAATLTHDAVGRRTQLQRTNGVTTTYTYDPASRGIGLTHAKGASILEQFMHTFDPADSKTRVDQLIQTATALPPAVTAAYNAANQQSQFGSATLTYDNNGNLTHDGTKTYTWDARDRLIGISGGTSATFTYDALNRRIVKTINGATSTYLYDGADIVTESGASNASYLSTLSIDEPLVRQSASGNEYYLANDLGSTIALTNDVGLVTTQYTYGPFGATTVTGTSNNPFQFTGRENDGTGLYYYRARYYSPSQSRFLSEDPLEFNAGDANLYGYVLNNPTNLIDLGSGLIL